MPQLLDNSTNLPGQEARSVMGFLEQYANETGALKVVSGYVSISALARFHQTINRGVENFQLVIGDYAEQKNTRNRVLNIMIGGQASQLARIAQDAQQAIEFLEQEKVKVKTLQPNFCHAKLYLFEAKDKRHSFHVIGSANMTGAGLGFQTHNNLELSVASHSEGNDFGEAQEWFNLLWNRKECKEKIRNEEGIELTFKQYLVEEINKLVKPWEPKEIYYKVLFELFKHHLDELDFDESTKRDIRHLKHTKIWKTLFPFQQKGVLSLIRKVQRFNGAILADAVGLGKTYSALAVIKFFELSGYRVILFCPKKLSHNWKQHQKDQGSRFNTDQFEYFIAYHTDLQDNRLVRSEDTKIDKYLKRKAEQKLLVVIDESHNFRNDKYAKEDDETTRYQFLVEKVLKAKDEVKVLLLSATPINTKLLDVRNQFKLLCQGRDDGFASYEEMQSVRSLESQFRLAETRLNEWIKDENPAKTVFSLINKLPDSFFTLTDLLLVARTRDMVTKVETSLHFPDKKKPDNRFQKVLGLGKYTSYMSLIEDMNFKLHAYQPAKFTKEGKAKIKAKKKTEDNVQRQEYLVVMMFSLLAKRLESSWYAFYLTLNNMLAQHQRALLKIQLYRTNPEGDETIDNNPDKDPDLQVLLEEMEDESTTADLTLGKKKPLKISDIEDLDEFQKAIEADVMDMKRIMANLPVKWNKPANPILNGIDHKLESLIDLLQKKQKDPNPKVILFTTFTDTAEYLFAQLKAKGFKNIALVTGKGATIENESRIADFEPALQRFAPYTKLYKEMDWEDSFSTWGVTEIPDFETWKALVCQHEKDVAKKLESPIQILIATDCLSEGQNLQDSDMVINYDIHWNPVRLIQRMGRIDRLGSPNQTISGVNFWPGEDLEDYLKLRNRVEHRLASMLLVGGEVIEVSEKLAQLRSDNPLLPEQEKKMYSMMQETWDGIDAGPGTFGLNDLSLDAFRQELLEELNQERKKYEGMPNGVFSGVHLRQDLFVNGLPPGMIALLGYPRRLEMAEDWKYEEHYLAYADPAGKQHLLTRQESLQILRDHKMETTYLSEGLKKLNKKRLDELQGWMEGWMDRKSGRAGNDAVQGLFNVKPTIPKTAEDEALEKKFKLENFDLIAWMELNT
jgi:superfamily II DNA or RNA helicase